MRRYAFESVLVHFAWLLFVFVFTNGFSVSSTAWLEAFNQWDARWYSSIAMDGHGFLPQTYAFPPFYGWILGRITYAIFDSLRFFGREIKWITIFYYVAFFAGFVSFATANSIFVWLSEKRWGISRNRLWLIAIANPVGYFAFTGYTDAFFFLLTALSLMLVTWTSERREFWRLPELQGRFKIAAHSALSLLLFAAPWVRLTGFAFVVWAPFKRKEVVATVAAVVAYLVYMKIQTTDALFFVHIQKVFEMPDGGVYAGLVTSLEILASFFNGHAYAGGDFLLYSINFGFLPIVVLVLSVTLIVWLVKREEKVWAALILAITLVSHNQAFWRSTVRYAMPIYPMLFWMMLRQEHGRELLRQKQSQESRKTRFSQHVRLAAFAVMLGLSLAFQIFYCRLFRSGGWAF